MSSSETGRFVRTAIVLIIIICMVWLMFSGCSSQLAAVSGISAPVAMKYTVNNPVTCEDIREGNGDRLDYHYIRVSGLKDKEVEQAVNDRIKAVYGELRVQDIPPYRGIKAKIPAGFTVRTESIMANVAGNFNNILSIVFFKYTTYQDPSSGEYEKDKNYYDGSKYLSETETLNFDLNTGKEIKLKDLFCDNVDYMEQINDCMSRFLAESYADDEGYYYYGMYGELKLVESFKGLQEDQRFAVYPYGIMFVFDYRTPQFETSSVSVCPVVNFSDFGDNIAVTKRFYSGNDEIYTSEEPPVKTFVMKDIKNDIVGNTNSTEDRVNMFTSWNYSSALPGEIKSKLKAMTAVDMEKVEELKAICAKLPPATEENPGGWAAYELMVFGDKTGDYYNTSRYTTIYLPDVGSQTFECHCYDGGTLKELKLQDLFREGYDYKPVVMKAIRDTVKNYDGNYEGAPSADYTEQQIETVYNGITGFNLSVEAVVIPIMHPVKGNQTYGLSVYIPYSEFGCDNMTIFD